MLNILLITRNIEITCYWLKFVRSLVILHTFLSVSQQSYKWNWEPVSAWSRFYNWVLLHYACTKLWNYEIYEVTGIVQHFVCFLVESAIEVSINTLQTMSVFNHGWDQKRKKEMVCVDGMIRNSTKHYILMNFLLHALPDYQNPLLY